MKKYALITITSFIISFVYYSFIFVIFGHVSPNIVIIFPIVLMLQGRKDSAYFSAFIFGIFADLFTGLYLGLTSIYLLLVVGAYFQIKNRIGYIKTVTAITTFISCILYDQFLQNVIYKSSFSWGASVMQALMSSIFVFVVAWLLSYIPKDFLKEGDHDTK